jgi:serine/threonine protein kinase
VKYNGAFFNEGYVNIVLEFMDLGSLETILKSSKQIPEIILGMITLQILNGLNYLHKDLKIIHRDIKPANILANSGG